MNNLTDKIDMDPCDLLHARTGCTAKAKLIMAYRNLLVTNTGLRRYHLTKKANKAGYSHKGFLCGTCARTKITRKHFTSRPTILHTHFLDKVSCDISVYINADSRDGWKYMLVFTDEATKMIWSYGLKDRQAMAVQDCLRHLHEHELPGGLVIKQFHSDGGAELITENVRRYHA